MRRADLQLSVSARKAACVLDPSLVLGHAQGPLVAMRLAQVLEPWLTRSFWLALDASELLLRSARGVAADGVSAAALAHWIRLRECTDAGSWVLRWIGDCIAESQLAESAEAGVLMRYEQLAEALQGRAERHLDVHAGSAKRWRIAFDSTNAALDAIALSAALDGALVLCAAADEPAPLRAAKAAALPVVSLEPMPADALFAAERSFLRQALAAAGLAALLEPWPRLSVLHALAGDEAGEAPDPWAEAHVWWYPL